MFQPIRRVLAAASLLAALWLAVPAPARAAAFPVRSGASAVAGRLWSWLESLVTGALAAKTGTLPVFQPTTQPEPSKEQGSMIDPNGIR